MRLSACSFEGLSHNIFLPWSVGEHAPSPTGAVDLTAERADFERRIEHTVDLGGRDAQPIPKLLVMLSEENAELFLVDPAAKDTHGSDRQVSVDEVGAHLP